MIKLENVNKKFANQIILNNINVTFTHGLIMIKGPSGQGKTTLLNILSTFDDDYQGNIYFNNINYKDILDKETFRKNNIGFIFQHPILFENLSVLDNICYDRKQDVVNKERIKSLLLEVGLKCSLEEEVKHLSGGEKQRLSLVRAIFHDQQVILCDEPTGALDAFNKEKVMEVIKKISKTKLIIMVTHEERFLKAADEVFVLQDGNLKKVFQQKRKNIIDEYKNEIPYKKLSFKIMINYIFKSLKAKKFRSLISFFALGIGLFSVGISSLINNVTFLSVEKELMSSFENKQYIIEDKNLIANDFNEIYAVSKEETQHVLNENPCIDYMGTFYLSFFENLFPDDNYFKLNVNDVSYPFTELNATKINEYHIIDNQIIFPTNVTELSNEEIILSLRKKDIRRICQNLHLDSFDYLALSNYLKYNTLNFTYVVKNDSWSYQTQINLKCRYFIIGEDIEIYHTNYAWNQYMFEDKMQLITSSDLLSSSFLPWTIKKVYYLKVNELERINIIKELLVNKKYLSYHFSFIDHNFYKDIFDKGRIFLTKQTRKRIDLGYLENNLNNINHYYGNGVTYYIHDQTLMNGFINPTFLVKDEKKVISLIDQFYISEENIMSMSLESDEFVFSSIGNIMEENNLRFDVIKDDDILYGRRSFSYQEIVISSKVSKTLFNEDNYQKILNQDIYFLTNTSSLIDKELFHNNFDYIRLKVVGIVQNESNVIFADPLWNSFFFIDNFSYSISDVLPNICIADKEVKLNSDFIVKDPFAQIYNDLNNVLYYVNLGLNTFSFISSLCAILMNVVIIYLFIEEKKKEICLMKALGIKEKEIKKMFVLFSLIIGLISFIYCAFILIITNIILSLELTSSLELLSSSGLFLSLINIFVLMVVISLLIGYITSFYCVKNKITILIKDK